MSRPTQQNYQSLGQQDGLEYEQGLRPQALRQEEEEEEEEEPRRPSSPSLAPYPTSRALPQPPPPIVVDYAYHRQPTAPHDLDQDESRAPSLEKRRHVKDANYRPTPLKWPFLTVLAVLFAVAIALVVYAKEKRNSKWDDAEILGRDLSVLGGAAWNRNRVDSSSMVAPGGFVVRQKEEAVPETAPQPADGLTEITSFFDTGASTMAVTPHPITTVPPPEAPEEFVVTTYTETECGPEFCTLVEIIESSVVSTSTSFTTFVTFVTDGGASADGSEVGFATPASPVVTTVTVTNTTTHSIPVTTYTTTVVDVDVTKTLWVTGTTETPVVLTKTCPSFNDTAYTTGCKPGLSTTISSISTSWPHTTYTSSATGSAVPSAVFSYIFSEETIISTVTQTMFASADAPGGDAAESETGIPPVASEVVSPAATYINTGVTTIHNTITIIPKDPEVVVVQPTKASNSVVVIPDTTLIRVVPLSTDQPAGGDQIFVEPAGSIAVAPVQPLTQTRVVPGEVEVIAGVSTLGRAGEVVTNLVTQQLGEQHPGTILVPGEPQTIVTNVGGAVETLVTTPPPEEFTAVVGGTVVSAVARQGTLEAGETATLFGSITNADGETVVVPIATTVLDSEEVVSARPATFESGDTVTLFGPTTADGGEVLVVPLGTTVLESQAVVSADSGFATFEAGETITLFGASTAASGEIVAVPTGTTVVQSRTVIPNQDLIGPVTVDGVLSTFTRQPPPETIMTTIGGVPTTFVTTPEPQTLTTMLGESSTVVTQLSTLTEDMVSSFTTTTSHSEHTTTFVSTPEPTSLVTTISGTPTTIVTTPAESLTTITSVIKGTTYTTDGTTLPEPTGMPEEEVVVEEIVVDGFTTGEYFVGKFLLPLYAVGLTVALRIIDTNAKLYQPFRALSDPAGSLGENSLNLDYDGLKGFVTPVATLLQGYPVPFVTTFMMLLSGFLAPLSVEAIGIKLTGSCSRTAIFNCAGYLGVEPASAIALAVLLGTILGLLLFLILLLRNYTTGLHSNPWSIAGIASLATNPEVRINGASKDEIKLSLAQKRFGIGPCENSHGQQDYGIILVDESGRQLMGDGPDSGIVDSDGGETDRATGRRRHSLPFLALTRWWRIIFLAIILAMFGLTTYYHFVSTRRNMLSDWIQQQGFGVRFLFAGVGVLVALSFYTFFTSVAIASPYAAMHRRSQPAGKSILLTRPTNAFFGIYSAAKRGDLFLVVVAFMAILTEFLPILLANVPYSLTQTRSTHVVCTYMTMAVLLADALVVFASLLVRWPHMPADPRTVAGAMYYVVESRMLRDFEGTSTMSRKERDQWLVEKGRRYFYGETPANAGGFRMAVEGDSVSDGGAMDRISTAYRGYEGT